MAYSRELDVFGYWDNGGLEEDCEREPLVHILAFDEYGKLQSITMTPETARILSGVLLRAAHHAEQEEDPGFDFEEEGIENG